MKSSKIRLYFEPKTRTSTGLVFYFLKQYITYYQMSPNSLINGTFQGVERILSNANYNILS